MFTKNPSRRRPQSAVRYSQSNAVLYMRAQRFVFGNPTRSRRLHSHHCCTQNTPFRTRKHTRIRFFGRMYVCAEVFRKEGCVVGRSMKLPHDGMNGRFFDEFGSFVVKIAIDYQILNYTLAESKKKNHPFLHSNSKKKKNYLYIYISTQIICSAKNYFRVDRFDDIFIYYIPPLPK